MKLPKFLQSRPSCWAGLDVNPRGLASFVMLVPKGRKLEIICRFWVAQNALMLPEFKNIPRSRQLIALTGEFVDIDYVISDIEEIINPIRLKALGFDRYGMSIIRRELEKRKINVVLCGQGFASMSPAIKTYLYLLENGELHFDDPVLCWMNRNVVFKRDPVGNLKPDDSLSLGAIGGMDALFMAIGLWNSRI